MSGGSKSHRAFARLAASVRHVRRGAPLFVSAAECAALYGVLSGSFKTSTVDSVGRAQVIGFFMTGDLLGVDGLASGRYQLTANALEDSTVAIMAYPLIETFCADCEEFERALDEALAREIAREQSVMLLLGKPHAEQRLAAFLLNLSNRLKRRGYSASDMNLRMTRADIGSYLGLKIETVSRLFTKFREYGILEVRQKNVRLIDTDRLQALAAARSVAR
jgi:CRP/FNR family transcriptional regulator